MISMILFNTNSKTPRDVVKSLQYGVKVFTLTLIMSSLFACQNETQGELATTSFTNAEHTQLLQKTKRAILDLDYTQVAILTAQIDVNRALPDHSSLLAWAVETQDPKLISMLIDAGAVAEVMDSNRFTPMIEACRYGNIAIIKALLAHGANPDNAIEDGTTAFQLCADSANAEVLQQMVSLGATLSAENDYGQTALMFAANAGNVDTLRYLASNGADINQQTQQGYSPLFFAIKSHNLAAVTTAIALGADVSATAKDGTTATQLGVYTKNYEFLTWFINSLDSLMTQDEAKQIITAFDRDGYQLLHAAVKANQPELVAALLNAGADPLTISQPSTLSWRYEANFKTESYIPPQLTPLALAEKNKLEDIAMMLQQEAKRQRI